MTIDLGLQGKVAIVTGAGGGIGRSIALEFARSGARVVINDIGVSLGGTGERSSAPAEETRSMIETMGGEAVISSESVSDWAGAKRTVEIAMDAFGQVDALVNNAGILRDVIFHKMDPSDWEAVIGVHLNGSFYMSRAVAEVYRLQNSGAFVHMTSTSGLIGNFGQANYSAAKMGIVGLSKSIALDMARFGVRSNCVAPFAWSRMTDSIPAKTPEEQARVERMKKMTPETNAPIVVFLASPAAAGVNGQIFAARMNEVFLFGQTRPIRSVQAAEGWTPETIAERAMPALRPNLVPMDRSGDIFSWDPV
ncbi:3-hydroxyacyl-CoA dehydrogenase [Defluviimonas sp. 20V17]|uniref:NAD(P)-dependent dehydrogenase, short-chain alcohol dehydrogenase family n=1 Tax=Allgaiera indica TaxID=765699 RepID=A0AAN4UT40_9RHOB|nr:SDR family NAD(P)-dependent oxidoreductase [Allgaiera indica]KDB01686.1 3-hydroxyacyl-CoA dehydrogenase [Defluviimonas sp. 20V17]GHE04023.1 short-chain dehydrogenase [Allgaiera indica]SDX34038.1 NAD(P)-dependent dehydrogenase, short-chain alcohol dehydrogenase family [Allgaiera indica]